MLNKEKIRLMTRTAIYEKREGKDDLKMNQYCSSDYVRFNMLKTLIGVTISVFLCSCIYLMCISEDIFQLIFKIDIEALARLLLTAYFLALVVYVIICLPYYPYKYSRAKRRLKQYNKNLTMIEEYDDMEESDKEWPGGSEDHDESN